MNKVNKAILMGSILALPAAAMAISATTELARVNGRAITSSDIQTALGGLNEGSRSSLLQDPATRRKILLGLIDQEVMALQAEKDKLDQEPDFKKAMEQEREKLLSERLLARNVGSKMSDSAAKKYYELHKNRFSTDAVQVQHILLSDEASAREMLKKAKAQGADFQELAEKFSKDPSAKNNRGDIGAITRSSPFVEGFKDAAFKAAEGDVVGPIHSDYGYHVIKVVSKHFGRILGYEEVELRVKEMLRAQLVDDYLNKLKAQSKISIDEEALKKL